jgi:hypothetical protein
MVGEPITRGHVNWREEAIVRPVGVIRLSLRAAPVAQGAAGLSVSGANPAGLRHFFL